MRLSSAAFEHEGSIPRRYTCVGDDVSPALALHDIPAEAVSLALIMDDPDAPAGTWVHWVAYDIPLTPAIPEAVASLGTPGVNSWGTTGYRGPCPPSGTHRYYVTVYALDTHLDLEAGADKSAVRAAMAGHALAEASLVGRFTRP
jgi:Raf kinase inhibitor-like YbhB/YbcL family protein